MKTSNAHLTLLATALPQGLGFAALSAEANLLPAAALSTELQVDVTQAADGWVQALPDGQFSAVDGRPHDVAGGKWLMDAQAFASLKVNTPRQHGDLVIDYEHQTLNKEKNGQPAPAAGFFAVDDTEYRPGKGLFIKPRWTGKAQAMLTEGEYKYFSLVFHYDRQTGRPVALLCGALTNAPGVDGMQPLASLMAELKFTNPQTKDSTMNQALKILLGLLGVTVEGDAEPTQEHIDQAKAAIEALQKEAGGNGDGEAKAALTALQTELGELKQAHAAVVAQLGTLSQQSGQAALTAAITKAKEEGRILEAEVGYYTTLGNNQGLAALTEALDARPAIAALSAQQTSFTAKPETKDPVAALTAAEKQMADAWGMSHEEFATAKKEQ